ncbi:MAG: hypothetical protein AAFV95_27320, partial [Bacteroidota bacterium]
MYYLNCWIQISVRNRSFCPVEKQDGKIVDVYVKSQYSLTSATIGNRGFNEPVSLAGLTDTQLDKQIILNGKPIATVKSSSGPGTATIFLDAEKGNGAVLSHEGGHVKYNVQNFYSYLIWLQQNKGKSSGGHGGGNPSGFAADKEEEIYINNTKGKK